MFLATAVLACAAACTPPDDDKPDTSVDAGFTHKYGFTIRMPRQYMVPCVGECADDDTRMAEEADFLCTLTWNGRHEYVYVAANPTQYRDWMGYTYEIAGAWHSDGTTSHRVDGVYYWGGNHHNDTLTVTVDGYQFRYNHSSFGWGYRRCQAPDCLQVYHTADGGEVQNGCLVDRALPEICVQVQLDGGIPELVDTFHWCPGDPDHDAGL